MLQEKGGGWGYVAVRRGRGGLEGGLLGVSFSQQ